MNPSQFSTSLLLAFAILFVGMACSPTEDLQVRDLSSLLQKMKNHLGETGVKEYTFVQETIRFDQEGNPRDTTLWYEAMQFPDKFRIDFGSPTGGNTVIYREDSMYYFKEGELVRNQESPMELTLLEGGLAVWSVEKVLGKMKDLGYDTGIFREDEFGGAAVYVIGAEKGDLTAKQVWIDQEKLTTRRRIDPNPEGQLVEAVFDKFENHQGLWVESWVEFYIDGKLLQTEQYMDLQVNPGLNANLFAAPTLHNEGHWYQP